MSRVLFYSKYCPHSQKFIGILEKTGEIIQFNNVCIDKINGRRPRVVNDYGIVRVPTIITDDQKLEGVEAFKWLALKIKANSERQQGQPQQQVQPGKLEYMDPGTNDIAL